MGPVSNHHKNILETTTKSLPTFFYASVLPYLDTHLIKTPD